MPLIIPTDETSELKLLEVIEVVVEGKLLYSEEPVDTQTGEKAAFEEESNDSLEDLLKIFGITVFQDDGDNAEEFIFLKGEGEDVAIAAPLPIGELAALSAGEEVFCLFGVDFDGEENDGRRGMVG